MKNYMLNNLGKDWIWEANSEEEATKIYIKEVCGAKTIEEYEQYCKEVNCDPRIDWEEENE